MTWADSRTPLGDAMTSTRASRGALAWTDTVGDVVFGGTDRHGGVSAEPYDTLNLGGRVADDPAAVAENRRRLADALGVDVGALVLMRQIHSREVAIVTEVPAAAPEVDAIVTTRRDLALVALGADCAPVVLADPEVGVIAAVHCGREGLARGVLPAAVAAMRGLGAVRIVARMGPTICGRCYEVPAELQAAVAAVVPAAAATTRWGTPGLDNGLGVLAVLQDLGVGTSRFGGCTYEDPDVYSYRRDGVTGRHAAAVVLRSTPASREDGADG